MPLRLPEELQFIANSRMAQKRTDARMDGRVCVITGATSGVGYEAARRLAFADSDRILCMRISIVVNRPLALLDRFALQKRLELIGKASD